MSEYEDIPLVMTVREVATLLRVGKNTIYDAIRCERLKAKKVGRSLRVTRQALLAFLEVTNAA